MATVNFSIRSKSNPTSVYCRLISGRAISIRTKTNILVNPTTWDPGNQKIRNVISVKNRDEINHKLIMLKAQIFEDFNTSFMNGEIIDKGWFDEVVSNFFNRPKQEVKGKANAHTIYYTDFADWWLENKSSEWLVGDSQFMSEPIRLMYETFVGKVKNFEGSKKLKLNQVTNKTITAFVQELNKDGYAAETIKRLIGRFKFFCIRAEEENFTVNKAYSKRVFVPKSEEEIKAPYFNPDEIEKIYNHDFSGSEKLDNVRDNLIIACWTGLRVSDFLSKLDLSNFIDDFIEIRTEKTKTPVVIPVHPMVKRILIKRNGQLPRKISDPKFNKYVKDVCEDAGFKQKMRGRLYDKDKKAQNYWYV